MAEIEIKNHFKKSAGLPEFEEWQQNHPRGDLPNKETIAAMEEARRGEGLEKVTLEQMRKEWEEAEGPRKAKGVGRKD